MTGLRCLVVGSVNVDVLGRVDRLAMVDEAVDVDVCTLAPGGHAGNAVSALATLGIRARLVACVGKDALGDLALGSLRRRGVEVDFVERVGTGTGVVFVPVLPDGGRTLYIARGANSQLSARSLERAANGCPLMAIFDPPPALLPELAKLANRVRMVFAPGSLTFAFPASVLRPLVDVADVVIVNEPESRTLTGRQSPRAAAIALAQGRRFAIVTVGARGCWIASSRGVRHVPAFMVPVSDSTGAGDAFVAGFCAAQLRGRPAYAAAREACAAGALAVRGLGAQASLPTRAEIAALLGQSSPRHAPPTESATAAV